MAALERTRTRADARADLWGRSATAVSWLGAWAPRVGVALCFYGGLSWGASAPGGVGPGPWALATAGFGLWALQFAARRFVRRRVPDLATRLFRSRWAAAGARELPVSELDGRELGAPVIVRGRVRALRRLPEVAGAPPPTAPAVWSHVHFSVVPWSPRQRTPFVYDLAEDFELVGEDGASVRVIVACGHLVPRADPVVAEEHECRLLALVPPAPGRWLFPGDRAIVYRPGVEAADQRLREGDAVTVFGAIDQVVAPDGPRGPREAPLDPCLRSLPDRPLIVVAG